MMRISSFAALLAVLACEDVHAQEAPEPEDTGPVTKDQLFADRDTLVPGTNVFLDDVKVRSKSGNLLRVSIGRRQLYVAPVDPSMLEFVTVGAIVDIHGSLREAPSAEQAELIYAASARAARRLARDRVYVDAWSVSTMP